MTKIINVDVDAMINPHFDDVLFDEAANKILKGGRGSTKSSVIALNLVCEFLQDPNANVLAMRKVANTIATSVYEQVKWAIYMLQVADQFKFKTSPYKIEHKATGTAFYFSGVDDPQKLKSFIIAKGYVRWLWFEELAEFDSWEEVDMVRASFTRKKLPNGHRVQTYYSYNPPRNVYAWVNQFVKTRRAYPNWYIDHSTYKDVILPNILADDYLEEIETTKKNDPDYYRWMYLGEAVGLGTNVYNMDLFNRLEEIPDDDHVGSLYFSADTGHAASATAVGAYGLLSKRDKNGKPRLVLLDTYYYSPQGKAHKKSPSELSKDIWEFIQRIEQQYEIKAWKYIMDSAEAALRNQMKNDYGLTWTPVKKLKKSHMIEYVQSLLAQGRFYYLPTENNVGIFIPQHEQYQWDEKTVESDDPHVIKENDHTNDSFQYCVVSILRELNLKY